MIKKDIILEVKDLNTEFVMGKKIVHAVNGISFILHRGEMLGIVGESGSGKSVTIRSILGLIPPPGRIAGGSILLEGKEIRNLSERELRKIRGTKFSMIFQEPLSALNPSFSIGWQVGEVFYLHRKDIRKNHRNEQVIEMLRKVKIPDPENRVNQYPHQFSGGMRQRGLISIALACQPDILFADEPTTALDVTVQAEIMDLIEDLRRDMNLSVVFISHNFNLIVQRCDRVIVMYAGQIMEEATSETLIENPLHPYTIGLINSIPDIENPDKKLESIPGDIANLTELPTGCPFSTRCEKVMDICLENQPEFFNMDQDHKCACHLFWKKEVASK